MTEQQFHTYQEQTFDAYCKRLIRNESINTLKALSHRYQHEIPFSTLSHAELAALAHEDTYLLEEMTLPIGEDRVAVHDLLLGQAIGSLPPGLREVVLLSYFLGRNDVQISRALDVTPKAIRYRKQKALDKLKEILEALGYEC